MVTRKTRDPDDRFWEKVDAHGVCWEWTAYAHNGYGRFCVKAGYVEAAHRYAYMTLVGEIPEGLHLDHLCRNTVCVNPDHLEPVTPAENIERGVMRARRMLVAGKSTHCKHGHEFTPENTIYVERYNTRACKECSREKVRRYRRRKKEARTKDA